MESVESCVQSRLALRPCIRTLAALGLIAVSTSLGVETSRGADPQPIVLHVSPQGSDKNPGSPGAPLATPAEALRRIRGEQSAQIVLHSGTYRGGLTVDPYEGPGSPGELIVSAAPDAGGGYVDAVIDGGRPVPDAEPVNGSPGVFRLPVPRVAFGRKVRLWEEDTGRRYQLVADQQTVAQRPASYWYRQPADTIGDVEILFHTSDGAPPSGHALWRSDSAFGVSIWRPNVTLRGLRFRNFVAWEVGAAIFSRAPETRVEEVRISNATRGIYFRQEAENSEVRDCEAEDVGAGVYSEAPGATISGCRLVATRRLDELDVFEQSDAGIEFYYPAVGGSVTGNLCVGFRHGLFIKTEPSRFVVERNTFIAPDGGWRGMGPNTWHPGSVYRFNVVSGFRFPLPANRPVLKATTVESNCFDPSRSATPSRLLEAYGVVDTPVFVSPAEDDYRLAHQSPCSELPGIGAMGIAPQGVQPAGLPPLRISLAAPAQLADRSKGSNPAGEAAGASPALWLAPQRSVALQVDIADGPQRVTALRVRIGDAAWLPLTAPRQELELPAVDAAVPIRVSLRDARGVWHERPPLLVIVGDQGPRLLEPVDVGSSRNGFVVSALLDRPAQGRLVYDPAPSDGTSVPAIPAPQPRIGLPPDAPPPTSLSALLAPPQVEVGRPYQWQLVARDALGQESVVGAGTFVLEGDPRLLHVATDGTDAPGRGEETRPFRTIQYAVDRALPGDQVVIASGLYTRPASVHRGGLEGAPLMIRSAEPGGAILDGGRSAGDLLLLDHAPHVIIYGLELRWFGDAGIAVEDSPDVVIAQTRIWNDHWFGWVDGRGVFAQRSPGIVLADNVIFRTATALWLLDSPRAQILHNTLTANREAGFRLFGSVRGSEVSNNSLAFNEIEAFELTPDTPEDLASFRSDWNNLGMSFRDPQAKELGAIRDDQPELEPRGLPLNLIHSKFLVRIQKMTVAELPGVADAGGSWKIRDAAPDDLRFYSLTDWRGAGHQDQHSIFADPLYVDPLRGDFRLSPDSPNVGAGQNGATIGARQVSP
jgi:hypothetical protein